MYLKVLNANTSRVFPLFSALDVLNTLRTVIFGAWMCAAFFIAFVRTDVSTECE
jgi:hypothetical protein